MDGIKTIPPLRIMQWNILADGLAQFGDFIRAPKEILEWSSRAPKLLNKILEASADIVCLQELNHYDDYFLPQLQQHGYQGIFKPKIFSPAVKYGCPPDGCAVFFRASRLQISAADGAQIERGIICCLKDLLSNEELVLATTHLKAKSGKENEAIRLRQVQELVQGLVIRTKDGTLPSVICGDFNSNPFSVVYKLVHECSLRLQSVYARKLELTSADNPMSPTIHVGNSIDGGASAEPPFTTWKFRSTGEKQETIDYIWFSQCRRLLPDRIWRLPSATSIGADGLPSEAMPSDHLPLTCEFMWNLKEGL
ncbi:unnamed protein product [Calypogeia fissa]